MPTTKTTKLLALTLSLLMLFTMIPLSVSADGATILDVATQDANGNYYLTGDVTVTATYADEFTGTFDGKGYTVTTSVPLFDKVNGATIKNLIVTGDITTGYAAVANCVIGAGTTATMSIFEKIENRANVTNTTVSIADGNYHSKLTSDAVAAGGIVGVVYSTSANFTGCVNTGNVTSPMVTGGIVSYLSGCIVTISNCKNGGIITATGDNAGGIVAFLNYNTNVTIEKCENTNTVQGTSYVGGIVGSSNTTDNYYNIIFVTACKNAGEIIASGTRAGGIVGYVKTQSNIYVGNISYCYNTADITAKSGLKECGGIVGCLADKTAQVVGCYNSGKITGQRGAQIYFTSVARAPANQNGSLNYYVSGGKTPYYSYNDGGAFDGNSTSYTEEELASGALALAMNNAIGKTVYYQNVNAGTTTDDHPVTDPTHGHVFKSGDYYYSIAFYTLNKASIRLRADHSGLRFATAVSVEDYNALKDKFTLSFGTLITPDAYLDVALGGGYSFTKDGLANLDTDNPYLDVTPAGVGTEVFNPLEGEDTKYYYFCGSITGIKEENHGWDYSAIGYVSVGEETFYSSDYVTSNISHIANLAYNDRQATQSTTYKYEIVANSEYAIDNKVSYSPYSPSDSENTIDELKIIKGYL